MLFMILRIYMDNVLTLLYFMLTLELSISYNQQLNLNYRVSKMYHAPILDFNP